MNIRLRWPPLDLKVLVSMVQTCSDMKIKEKNKLPMLRRWILDVQFERRWHRTVRAHARTGIQIVSRDGARGDWSSTADTSQEPYGEMTMVPNQFGNHLFAARHTYRPGTGSAAYIHVFQYDDDTVPQNRAVLRRRCRASFFAHGFLILDVLLAKKFVVLLTLHISAVQLLRLVDCARDRAVVKCLEGNELFQIVFRYSTVKELVPALFGSLMLWKPAKESVCSQAHVPHETQPSDEEGKTKGCTSRGMGLIKRMVRARSWCPRRLGYDHKHAVEAVVPSQCR